MTLLRLARLALDPLVTDAEFAKRTRMSVPFWRTKVARRLRDKRSAMVRSAISKALADPATREHESVATWAEAAARLRPAATSGGAEADQEAALIGAVRLARLYHFIAPTPNAQPLETDVAFRARMNRDTAPELPISGKPLMPGLPSPTAAGAVAEFFVHAGGNALAAHVLTHCPPPEQLLI